jgi:hypothetical protein
MTSIEHIMRGLGPDEQEELRRGVDRQLADPFHRGPVMVPPRFMSHIVHVGPTVRMQMHGCDVEMAILALWSVKSMRRIAAIASRFGTPSIETMAAELTRLRAISAPPRTGMRA